HPAVVRSAMLMVLLAAVGCAIGAGLLWQEQQRTRQQKEAAEKRLAYVEKANEILASIFRDLGPDDEEKGGPPLRLQLAKRLDEASRLLEGYSSVGDPRTVGRLQAGLGNCLHQLGYYQKALPLLLQARENTESALGPEHPDTLLSKHNLATLY